MACQEWLTPRPWSGFSFPETRSVAVRLGGLVGSCPGRRPPHSRSTLFANGTTPLAAAPVHHTDRKPALYPTSAASGWQPSLLRCNAFALFSCVLSAILTEERPLQFQLRQDTEMGGAIVTSNPMVSGFAAYAMKRCSMNRK